MKLIILGAGGYGQTVADVAEQSGEYEEIHFLDDNSIADNIIGKCVDFVKYKDCFIYPAFGNNKMRLEWIERLLNENYRVPTIIHPTAYISPKSKIEEGCVILPHAVINTNCVIDSGCIINCGAIIDHGCVIEQGCHICLGAIVKAENRIAKFTKIEAGEVVQAKAISISIVFSLLFRVQYAITLLYTNFVIDCI